MAERDQAPGDADGPEGLELVFPGRVEAALEIARPVRDRKARAERIDAARAQRLEALAALTQERR